MRNYTILILPEHVTITACEDTTLIEAFRLVGFHTDAPCGGRGDCGKCKVLLDGQEILACQTVVDRDMVIELPQKDAVSVLADGIETDTQADGAHHYVLAFDIGTTTVVAYLLDGRSGKQLAYSSCLNPQTAFGADVITRIQYVVNTGNAELKVSITNAMSQLTQEASRSAGIDPKDIGLAAVVGNTAMHHLLLGIDPKSLITPPYMPAIFEALELSASKMLPIAPDGIVHVLPNIAGFVGADTVGCMTAVRFDQLEKLTLMIDIGTNGEMILGNTKHRLACSAAAGPAFEGAKISCGMRGMTGAVDRVWIEGGNLCWHVIGNGIAVGLCGSGLLDLVSCLLNLEVITGMGRMACNEYRLGNTNVVLTQQDVREVQLAKGAIRAGIELMCNYLGHSVEDIQAVYLAGAFGNYLNSDSACRIGMIPPELRNRVCPIGNAAGMGAKICALSQAEFEYSKRLARNTEFLELASLRQFQEQFVDSMRFEEVCDD